MTRGRTFSAVGGLLFFAWCVLCGALAGYAPPAADTSRGVARNDVSAVCAPAFRIPDGGAVRIFRSGRPSGVPTQSYRTQAGTADVPGTELRELPHTALEATSVRFDFSLRNLLRFGIPVRAGPVMG